jgi:hypothetical protein
MVSTIEMCIGVLSETTISRLHFQNFPGLFAICHETQQAGPAVLSRFDAGSRSQASSGTG